MVIVLIELNAQYAVTHISPMMNIFGCTHLTKGMHITSACLAVGTLIVGALVKFIPYGKCEKLPAIPEGKVSKTN
jgi:predicted signal transduction protein with EAL and GGDEF domain